VEKPTDADWILKAMVALAAADGRLDAREVTLIQKVYQQQTGRSVEVSGVLLAVQAYATRRDVLAELSAAVGTLGRETGEKSSAQRILRCSPINALRKRSAKR
jgi:uncharacterized membrane protein YebE (DUF533 family)